MERRITFELQGSDANSCKNGLRREEARTPKSWHEKFPDDWKQTWLEVQKKWANDIGCPDGLCGKNEIDALHFLGTNPCDQARQAQVGVLVGYGAVKVRRRVLLESTR